MLAVLVRTHRRRLGMTQEALALAAGLSARTIRDIETGRIVHPRPATVTQLAEAFGLSATDRAELHEATAVPAAEQTGPPMVETVPVRLRPTPAQLPADLSSFAGRRSELARLDALLGRTDRTPIATITGTAGAGKTTLALHWAHQAARRFADGQLYVDLRGFGPERTVVDLAQVIRGFLDAFGLPAERVPADLPVAAALYRSVLAGRRVLVLLDNARDADQVRPLLPGTAGCLAIVTSRSPLTGLIAAEDAYPITLDLLSSGEARDMLARRLGADRVAREPDAVARIVERCLGLPLALSVVAARASRHPDCPLATLAAELGDPGRGISRFDRWEPAADVRAVFSWSYRVLSPGAARLFRLLGLYVGAEISAPAAGSLAGLSGPEAVQQLAELAGAGLLAERVPGRYTCHDLLRGYAAELAHEVDADAERREAVGRLLDHYVHSAHAAALLLQPHRDPITLDSARPGTVPELPSDDERATAWLDVEYPVLLAAMGYAAAEGYDVHAWQLAWALADFLDRRGRWHEWADTHTVALDAARRAQDAPAQAYAHRGIARAYIQLGRWDEAHPHLRSALALYGAEGDVVRQAHTQLNRAELLDRQRRHREALDDSRAALRLYREAGHRSGQANALNSIGWCNTQLGNHREALASCRRALALHREIGYRIGAAETWDSLGQVYHNLGDHSRAGACYRHALEVFRDAGDRAEETDTLTRLGDSHLAAGRREDARTAWRTAQRIREDLGHAEDDRIRNRLEQLDAV